LTHPRGKVGRSRRAAERIGDQPSDQRPPAWARWIVSQFTVTLDAVGQVD
jgi:hypothetical protein